MALDNIMSGEDFSIVDAFEAMREMGAGIMKLVPRDEDGKALCAVILIDGEDTEEILAAIEAVEKKWDEDDLPLEEQEG